MICAPDGPGPEVASTTAIAVMAQPTTRPPRRRNMPRRPSARGNLEEAPAAPLIVVDVGESCRIGGACGIAACGIGACGIGACGIGACGTGTGDTGMGAGR